MIAGWMFLAFCALLLLAIVFRPRAKCPTTGLRGHVWNYGTRGVSGWGVVRCSDCGREDLY